MRPYNTLNHTSLDTPYWHPLLTHPPTTPSHYTIITHHFNTPSQHTLSIFLTTHPLNPPLSTHYRRHGKSPADAAHSRARTGRYTGVALPARPTLLSLCWNRYGDTPYQHTPSTSLFTHLILTYLNVLSSHLIHILYPHTLYIAVFYCRLRRRWSSSRNIKTPHSAPCR